jgi:hypothetical protein
MVLILVWDLLMDIILSFRHFNRQPSCIKGFNFTARKAKNNSVVFTANIHEVMQKSCSTDYSFAGTVSWHNISHSAGSVDWTLKEKS